MDAWYLVGLFVALLAGILSGVPVMLVLLGMPLLVAGIGTLAGHFDPTFLQAFPQRVYGLAGNTLLIAVPLFVAMGLLLEKSRAAERMLLVMARLLGGSRTSLAWAVIAVSALIAASTGIIGATIVMLGLISLPAMVRAGLPVGLASGLVCASGTLGQIIPPSIVLILLGDRISTTYLEAQHAAGNFAPEPVSVADLFAGALLPGLLLVTLYALYVTIRAARLPPLAESASPPAPATALAPPSPSPTSVGAGLRAADATGADASAADDPDAHAPLDAKLLLRVFLPPLLLICSVLGSILGGVATPTEAAAVGAAGSLLLAAASLDARRPMVLASIASVAAAGVLVARDAFGLAGAAGDAIGYAAAAVLVAGLVASALVLARRGTLGEVLRATVGVTAMVFGIIVGASMLSLVFRGFGGDEAVAALLEGVPGGDIGLLLVVSLVIFGLGFVLEFVEIIFIVVPIVGPTLFASDLDPVWIGILIAMNLQTSFLTPPFGFALFYFRSVAPPSFSTFALYRAVLPFVGLQSLALCLVFAFPALATWLPGFVD